VAIDDREQISELVKYVCATYPDLPVIARATDRDHVYDLYAYGCRNIIRETYDSSLRMGRSALEVLGFERATAQGVVEHLRHDATARRSSRSPMSTRIGVQPSDNPEYVAAVREIARAIGWSTLQREVADMIARPPGRQTRRNEKRAPAGDARCQSLCRAVSAR
jgi:CPA2 family monovalent cation:H+ antiporter-2